MGKLFGTDGIRGEANRYPMDATTAFAAGQAVTHVLKKKGHTTADHHRQGHAHLRATCSRAPSSPASPRWAGSRCWSGVLPTPGIAFMTESMRADAGIVISASHNPFQDNGIKLFSGQGFKLSDDAGGRDRGAHAGRQAARDGAPSDEMGRAYRLDDANGRYVVFLKNTFPRSLTLEGMKIALDVANGATYRSPPRRSGSWAPT